MTEAPPEPAAPLTLEQDFTRHLMSLFGSLYDSRAFPYIGPIPPSENAAEPPPTELPDAPPFESALCDFRLKLAFANDVDNRQALLDALSTKSATIQSNAARPDAPTKVVLGERLPARTVTGKNAEAERQATRQAATVKLHKAGLYRRMHQLDDRKTAVKRASEGARRDEQELLRQIQDMRTAELAVRHEFAEARKLQMIQRKRQMDARRAEEFGQVEEARRTVESVSYRSTSFRPESPRADDRQDRSRSRQLRIDAGKAAREHNERTIRPTKELRSTKIPVK